MSRTKVARDVDERFRAKVADSAPTDCWPWTDALDKQGRGVFWIDDREGMILAARYAWQLKHKQAIPPDWECIQRCRNFACCNPAHLFIQERKLRYLTLEPAPDTIHANFEEYLQWMVFNNYAVKSVPTYATSLGKFARWLTANVPAVTRVDGITRHHFRAFIPWLANTTGRTGERIAPGTFAKDAYAVKSMLGYFRTETDLVVVDPSMIRLPRTLGTDDHVPTTVATAEEVERLIATCDPSTPIGRRDAAIFALLFSSGLRVHELCGLERSTFPRERLGKDPTFSLPIKGKGRHVRIVFVDDRAQRFLLAMLADRTDHDPALFVNHRPGLKRRGRVPLPRDVLSARGVQLAFHRHAAAAGLADRKLTPHTMRHGLAVDLLEGGADLRTVQDVLGHRNIATTTIYTKLSNRQLEAGYLKRKSLQGAPGKEATAVARALKDNHAADRPGYNRDGRRAQQ